MGEREKSIVMQKSLVSKYCQSFQNHSKHQKVFQVRKLVIRNHSCRRKISFPFKAAQWKKKKSRGVQGDISLI